TRQGSYRRGLRACPFEGCPHTEQFLNRVWAHLLRSPPAVQFGQQTLPHWPQTTSQPPAAWANWILIPTLAAPMAAATAASLIASRRVRSLMVSSLGR